MNGQLWMYGVMIVAGVGIPVMAAMNASLGVRIGAPASVMSLLTVGLIATTCIAIALNGLPDLNAMRAAPPWLFLAGLAMVFYILSITWLAPRMGIGPAILCVLLGQIICAALIDHFGWFGAVKSPLDLKKLIGICLMIAGIYLARRPA
ncbi:DMT family transporter [Ponticaulis koreensis]|uniref:DMT family transporter n=1 Tax=Ponticaulis koreensis TaxID=1123045 RepID=UPI0003B6CF49|nr:DMT family transporter [Ponticaulis koreensis]